MLRRSLINVVSVCVLTAVVIAAVKGAQSPEAQTGRALSSSKPKVRAITGFVRLDQLRYREQIAAALTVLRKAKGEFEAAGYEVESVRITTQPVGELVKGMSNSDALGFLKKLDDLSVAENFLPNVGPAMLRDSDDPKVMRLFAEVLSKLPNIEGSAIVAADDGLHWKVIRESAVLVRYVAENSAHSQGNFNFTATAMLQPYAPFFPGSYHTGAGERFAIGFEGASVVQEVFARTGGDREATSRELASALTRHAQLAELIGNRVALATGWKYMGVDPTPAPLGDVSIADAVERYTGGKFGSSGTMTAAMVITSAVKAVPVTQVGYSGLMVPVLEDKLLAQRWAEGRYNIDSLLAYSAVCGTGLDTVPLPGDITEEQLARIFGDMATLAWKWRKPLSARLLPVYGKRPGERTEFSDPYLFNTILHPLP